METKFKTRICAGGDAHTTIATFNMDGVTDEQLHELARKSLVIMVQSEYRIAGNVPATDTINVADMLNKPRATGGAVATPENTVKRIAKMSPEQRAEVMALLLAEERIADNDAKPAKSKK